MSKAHMRHATYTVEALKAAKRPLVTERKVVRFFYSGKGSPTRRGAYAAIARGLLLDYVLGEQRERLDDYGPVFDGDAVDTAANEAASHQFIDALFAEKFPHTEQCNTPTARAFCVRDEGYYDGERTVWSFRFKSCRRAQQEWLDAKVRELIEYDRSLEEKA